MRKGVGKLRQIDHSLVFDHAKLSDVQLMVKTETYPDDFTNVPIKKARGIQFMTNERTAYGNAAEFRAYAKSLEHCSKEPLTIGGVNFTVVYASSMNHSQIADFATESELIRGRYHASCLDERDGSNWDANVQEAHRRAILGKIRELDRRLAEQVEAGISVWGKANFPSGHQIQYQVTGSVKSGHPDTSSGNSDLNREISIQAILALPSHLRPVRVRALVMGDDYIAWLYFDFSVNWDDLRKALDAAESTLGIVPKRALFKDVQQVSFISLTFYWTTSGRLVAVPKLGRIFARLFWTVSSCQGQDLADVASAIAESFLPIYIHFRPMAKFLKRHVVPHTGRRSDILRRFDPMLLWDEKRCTNLAVFMGVMWARGNAEKYPAECLVWDLPEDLPCPGIVHDPVVSTMYRCDIADPSDRPFRLA